MKVKLTKIISITTLILLMLTLFNNVNVYAVQSYKSSESESIDINNWDMCDKKNYQALEGTISESFKNDFDAGKILDYLYSIGDYEENSEHLTAQGGISSKKKISFTEDFNISFKNLVGGYSDYPEFRGNAFSVGFHKDTPKYINSDYCHEYSGSSNLSAGIAGAKNSFALIIDYNKGGSNYSSGHIYLADTSIKTNNKKDFKKISPIQDMWWNKTDYIYNEFLIKKNMAVANISITWNSKKQEMSFLVTDSIGGGYAPQNRFEYTIKAKDHPDLIDPEGEYTFMSAATQSLGNNSTTSGTKFYEKQKVDIIHEDKNGGLLDEDTYYGEIDDNYDTSTFKLKEKSGYKFLKIKEGSLPEQGKFPKGGGKITYVYERIPNEANLTINTNKQEYNYNEEVQITNTLENKDNKRPIKSYELTTKIDQKLSHPTNIKLNNKPLTTNKENLDYYTYNEQTRELKVFSNIDEIQPNKNSQITYSCINELLADDSFTIVTSINSFFTKNLDKTFNIPTKINLNKAKIQIKYTPATNTKENKEIFKDQIIEGYINTDYDVQPIKANNYKVKLIKGQTKGKFTKETKEIIFEYEKTQNITDLIPTGFENITYIIYITIILLILFIFRKRIIK